MFCLPLQKKWFSKKNVFKIGPLKVFQGRGLRSQPLTEFQNRVSVEKVGDDLHKIGLSGIFAVTTSIHRNEALTSNKIIGAG